MNNSQSYRSIRNTILPDRLVIGLVGVFENPHSTSHCISSELQNNPQVKIVREFDYRMALRDEPKTVAEVMKTLAESSDVLIILKGNGLSADIIRECSNIVPVYLYWMDWWNNMKDDHEFLKGSRYCHWRSMTAYGAIPLWENAVGLPVHNVLDGADTSVFFPIEIPKKYDVIFVGTKDSERKTAHDMLKMMGYDVHFFGPGFNRYITPQEFNTLCAQSRIVLNMSRGNADGSTSVRLWNLMSAGAFVMTKTIPKMHECLGLIEGRHLSSFNDFMEFSRKAKVYLNHDRLRESVGCEARNWVLTHRTWAHTADNMLNLLRTAPPQRINGDQ